ncbi:unnamed protein product [Adineta ricciae]|uniref:G-protein coupled receptors family 1 profile domain-containing protein n=1 Tax=Adineta ricciae TaxID=249248 RepID=A0A815PCQ1_ADIRI|nr:unnamed protein product [Adineta ricciae]
MKKSLFYCKFRLYLRQLFSLTLLTSLCLATIDQYLATSSRPRYQQWSNMTIAHRLTVLNMIVCIVHNISYLICYDHVVSKSTGKPTCSAINNFFQQYVNYVILLTLGRILPIWITVVFGLLAYWNIRRIAYRTLPFVRHKLEKQFTKMALFQIIITFLSVAPYFIVYLLSIVSTITQDKTTGAQLQLASTITLSAHVDSFANVNPTQARDEY